jgi:predicted nucleic acid-binding protein
VIWLLDTNIFIPALNGRPEIRAKLNEASGAGEVVTSVLVLGELLYGARCSRRSTENVKAVELELSRMRIVPLDERIARRAAELKADLRQRGITKSDIDLLIATTALDLGATLVTDDGALLAGDIEGLLVEDWLHSKP